MLALIKQTVDVWQARTGKRAVRVRLDPAAYEEAREEVGAPPFPPFGFVTPVRVGGLQGLLLQRDDDFVAAILPEAV